MARKREPKPRPRQSGKLSPPFDTLRRFDQPLMFDPDDPEAFLKEATWRYWAKLQDSAEPVAITRLLNHHEIYDVKQIETAVDGMQREIERILERKEREDRVRGGSADKRLRGVVAWVETRLSQGHKYPTAKALWQELELATERSCPSLEMDVGDRRYEVFRDGERLCQLTTWKNSKTPGKSHDIGFDAFRRNYVSRAKKELRSRASAEIGK